MYAGAKRIIVDLETETVASAILLGRLRPAGRVEVAMSALISQKNRWVTTREAFDRMLAELHPDIELAGEQYEKIRRKLVKLFDQSAAMRVSLASLTIVSLALIWLVIGIIRLRNEFNQFQAQRAVQEDQLRQQAQQDRARTDELNIKLERELDENAMLQRELSKMQAQFGRQAQRSRP
jgi:uncharacterized membrane protein YciS (DUF1049 family)